MSTELSPMLAAALIAGGALAGLINTLAGSGSAVTLSLLLAAGLSAPVANGTNRVGVLVQCISAVATLWRAGKLRLDTYARALLGATVAGALAGAWLATRLDASLLQGLIVAVMVVLLVVVLVRPKRWLREASLPRTRWPKAWHLALFALIGAYGGLLQAGVGVMLLSALVLAAGFAVVEGNALKNLIVLVYTAPALGVFVYHDQVDWRSGLLLASGQALGAWLAARFAIGNARAALWVRRLLVVVLVGAILKFGWSLLG